MKSKIIIGAWLLTLASFVSRIYADDIYKAVKPPTNWQIDERIAYSNNNKGIESLTNNLILKYWDGNKFGKWGFINLPYKQINSPKDSKNGIGDIAVGAGPRGTIKDLHYFLYAALTFPTGNSEANLGNGRYDSKVGLMTTYLTFDKRYELDGIIEYTWTGKNKNGINPINEIYAGLLAGGKINSKVRAVSGFTGLVKGDNYLIDLRVISRYIFSKKWHIQLVLDKNIKNVNLPKKKYQAGFYGFYIRHNF